MTDEPNDTTAEDKPPSTEPGAEPAAEVTGTETEPDPAHEANSEPAGE